MICEFIIKILLFIPIFTLFKLNDPFNYNNLNMLIKDSILYDFFYSKLFNFFLNFILIGPKQQFGQDSLLSRFS